MRAGVYYRSALTLQGHVFSNVVPVHGVGTSQVPRGGEMVPSLFNEHLLHLLRS
jgi:hypothetical protein